jgi:hypothetical protein
MQWIFATFGMNVMPRVTTQSLHLVPPVNNTNIATVLICDYFPNFFCHVIFLRNKSSPAYLVFLGHVLPSVN